MLGSGFRSDPGKNGGAVRRGDECRNHHGELTKIPRGTMLRCFYMRMRALFVHLLVGFIVAFGLIRPALADPIKVGPYLLNTESVLTASMPRYSVPLNLSQKTRLVVQVAPQYALDFGIIPAADLRKWRAGQPTRFLFRLSGETDTRYITLNAGSYYVVARDLNGGGIPNGFAVKVRKFKGTAKDGSVIRTFVNARKESLPVAPNSWNGFAFQVPSTGELWFEGVFSRGTDRRVKWEILTEREYRKFISGLPHTALLSGSNPTALGFHFMASPAPYYFLLTNSGTTYSAYAVVRELYR